MKKTIFVLALIASVIANAQIFAGKGDQKVEQQVFKGHTTMV
jgi:hypothetical protein